MLITHSRNEKDVITHTVRHVMNPVLEARDNWESEQSLSFVHNPISRGDAYRKALDEAFPVRSSLGGYPRVYLVVPDNQVLCADCARTAYLEGEEIIKDILWEGPPEYCEECGAEIEAAYGDPNSDE